MLQNEPSQKIFNFRRPKDLESSSLAVSFNSVYLSKSTKKHLVLKKEIGYLFF